ncbi:hypothetical protein Clacol_005504 [Clathrus columnatus]|uniref:RhoGAP-domain-containing protein n=1 Tax=Clathrus columnatus TaxID=1419009 RepID=A0AAV5AC75_9AGAM|nr:hypothetical protein Clacol_005504 [Clathrus columnatus]
MATTVSTPERKVGIMEEKGHSGHSSSSSRTRLTSSPSRPLHNVLTVESVLQNAQGDTTSAIQMLLNERNLLSAQNSQLWKLVEKQRNVHATVSKELERVRAERDKAIAKLDSGREDQKLKPSLPLNSTNSDLNPDLSSTPAERINGRRTPTSQNQLPADYLNLAYVTPSFKVSGSLLSSRSHEPIRSRTDDPVSLSSPVMEGTSTQPNNVSSTPRTSSPIRTFSDPRFGNLPTSSTTKRRDESPSKEALLQPRTPKQPGSSSNPPRSVSTPNSGPSANTKETPTTSKLTVPLRDRALARESRITLPDEARRYIASLQDSPITSPHSHEVNFSSVTVSEEPSPMENDSLMTRGLHNEGSPVSMPHALVEQNLRASSPQTPHVEHKTSKRGSSEERRTSESRRTSLHANKVVPDRKGAMTPPPPLVPYGTIPSGTPHLYPDVTPQPWESSSHPVFTSASRELNANLDAINSVSVNTISSTLQSTSGQDMNLNTTPKANNFQSTPSSNARAQVQAQRLAYAQAQAQSQSQVQPQLSIQNQPQLQLQVQPQAPTQGHGHSSQEHPSNELDRSTQVTPEQRVDNVQKVKYSRSTKRMYLLEGDLQRCKISVVGSHIRPNDRGKEVLSFSIQVSPTGSAETDDSWKVEKLYSDVLALDARVRNRLSRSSAKKLANLPDSKLFKDNAPTKVDQRKTALEVFLQSVVRVPIKEPDDICDFFSTDIINDANAPVTQLGYKEGYLTKRGKNFGGWKTRYFVLQGPRLEYYESRGGAHLGYINITGAQIGRQQRPAHQPPTDDENEYRHAFLIIEQKRSSTAGYQRHVLCAESDLERDNWVEVLVRYVTGTYDDAASSPSSVMPTTYANAYTTTTTSTPTSQPRPSTSSIASYDSTAVTPSKRQIKSNMTVTPSHDNPKLLHAGPNPDSASSSPLDHHPSQQLPEQMSSSLPTQLNAGGGGILSQRAASELGHYPDLGGIRQHYQETQKPFHRQDRQHVRASMHPGLHQQTHDIPGPSTDFSSGETPKVKISGPINGTPIPAGYKFGAKDVPSGTESGSERDRKSKSRTFWGFGRSGHNNGHGNNNLNHTSPAVFGVPIVDALQVAQIANLPAVVFRCIQYLEAKKADQEEGIYRLSGSTAVIKSLRDRFNAEGDVDLLGSDEFWDLNAIAGLLKSYLRELPTSILTRDLHLKFLAVMDLADQQERIDELAQIISQLPVANYSLLRALTAHLILIVQNSAVNKMTMRNVGIVFSPTLGIPAGVFGLMLGEFNRVFNVDGETAEGAEGEDETTTLNDEGSHLRTSKRTSVQNNRNSRSYADGAVDEMLGLGGRTLQQEEESDSADEITLPDSLSEVGSEAPDPDATAQFSKSNLEIPQSELTEDVAESSTPSTSRTKKPDKASAVAASRGLHVTVNNNAHVFAGLPASPRPPVLFLSLTPVVIADGFQFYTTFYNAPLAVKGLLHGMVGLGVIGLIAKLHEWDESAIFFDGSSLVLYVFGIIIYSSVTITGLRTIVVPAAEDTKEDQVEALRILSAGNTLIALCLVGVLLLQGGQEYARRVQAKAETKAKLEELHKTPQAPTSEKKTQKVLGHLSPWHGYFLSLPKQVVDIAPFWHLYGDQDGIDARQWLRGTEAEKILTPPLQRKGNGMLLEHINAYFETVAKPVLRRELGVTNASLPEFHRAYSIVSSRAFFVDAYLGLSLVPFADIHDSEMTDFGASVPLFQTDYHVCPICGSFQECGHDTDSADDWRPVSPNYTTDDTCEIVANLPIGADEEVFNTYGDGLTNAQLLCHYGFMLDGNEHNTITWTLDELLGEDAAKAEDGVMNQWKLLISRLNHWKGTQRVYNPTIYQQRKSQADTDGSGMGENDERTGSSNTLNPTPGCFNINADGQVSLQLWMLLFIIVLASVKHELDPKDTMIELIHIITGWQERLEGQVTMDDDSDPGSPLNKANERIREVEHRALKSISANFDETFIVQKIAGMVVEMCGQKLQSVCAPELSEQQIGEILDNEGSDVYCSKQCRALDQSLAQSLPTRAPYYRRSSFDLPVVIASARPTSTSQPSQKQHRRAHFSDPTYNVTRFRDEELQDLHVGACVPSQYPGKDREGILRWVASIEPGLQEEISSSFVFDPSSSVPSDLDRLTRPLFPLTAQNLAPPCVTIEPRHTSVFHDFSRSQHERRTAPSLIQSQDDASFLTPATESVNTPSVPDASSTASSHAARPFLDRFVNKISSWISSPTRIPRPSNEAHTTLSPEEEQLVHSDDTLRVHVPYQEKTSVVQIPQSLVRHKRPGLITSPSDDYV